MDKTRIPCPSHGMDPTKSLNSPETSTTPIGTSYSGSRKESLLKSGESDESIVSKIDSKSPLRKGYPGPLVPLPLLICAAAPNTEESINWSRAREIIHGILSNHLVNDFSVSVVNRLPPSLARQVIILPSENQNLTCLIETKRDVHSNSWNLAPIATIHGLGDYPQPGRQALC